MSRELIETGEKKMADTMKGSLTISRPRGGSTERVEIAVRDEMSGSEFVTVRISPADFAEALFGLAYVPCEFFHRPERVGLQYQHKEEFVPFADNRFYAHGSEDRQRIAAVAFKPFEVDGWQGRVDDLFNPHRRGQKGARVVFTRYVTPEVEQS